MDKVLQAGLSAGMSATAGIHHAKPKRPPPELNGKNVKSMEFCPDPKSRVSFRTAKNPVKASYVCIGAWPWGDKPTWNWSDDELSSVKEAWEKLYEAGINFIDTAESYGSRKSEEIVGHLVSDLARNSYVIQTKYLGTPASPQNYLHPVDAPLRSLKQSLERLRLTYVDIYLVHGPAHPQSIEHMAKGMAKCVTEGLASAVGVANYTPEEAQKFADELAKYKVPLSTNQCEYNVLQRHPELHHSIATCEQNGMVFQGYSSLAQGRLSGKYGIDNPPPKTPRFSNYDMTDVEPTLRVLRGISLEVGKSMASVSLNYCVSKGALPVVGIRNAQQAEDAIGALGWRLNDQQMAAIDGVSMVGETTGFWQQG